MQIAVTSVGEAKVLSRVISPTRSWLKWRLETLASACNRVSCLQRRMLPGNILHSSKCHIKLPETQTRVLAAIGKILPVSYFSAITVLITGGEASWQSNLGRFSPNVYYSWGAPCCSYHLMLSPSSSSIYCLAWSQQFSSFLDNCFFFLIKYVASPREHFIWWQWRADLISLEPLPLQYMLCNLT